MTDTRRGLRTEPLLQPVTIICVIGSLAVLTIFTIVAVVITCHVEKSIHKSRVPKMTTSCITESQDNIWPKDFCRGSSRMVIQNPLGALDDSSSTLREDSEVMCTSESDDLATIRESDTSPVSAISSIAREEPYDPSLLDYTPSHIRVHRLPND